jgi:site-specific DNA-methyltransferase (adenine-specific)
MQTRQPHTRRWQITHADCFDKLPKLAPDSVDTVITDPPYGISLNGTEWDRPARLNPEAPHGRRRRPSESPNERFQQFSRAWSSACLNSLKPGGHIAAFAAPRTAHRLSCGLEEAGLEVRDVLMWLQGQGYPATRVLPDGLGTGLKPAWESIILARKPLDGDLDATLAKHGTGALNIDACRLPRAAEDCQNEGRHHDRGGRVSQRGRWPANLLLSHGEGCTAERCVPGCPAGALSERHRFFYCAKAPRREREAGCEDLPRRVVQTLKASTHAERASAENPVANIHPTVKPIDLMRWLVRLVNPRGGLVLDPFTGSGSTGIAAVLEGARFHGIERDTNYVPIARARITYWSRRPACAPATPRQRRTTPT